MDMGKYWEATINLERGWKSQSYEIKVSVWDSCYAARYVYVPIEPAFIQNSSCSFYSLDGLSSSGVIDLFSISQPFKLFFSELYPSF